MKQLAMKLPMRGGKRTGAGRKPNGDKPGASHERRPKFATRHPVHVRMRLLFGVGFLRGFTRRRAIKDALRAAKERFGMRVVHYSIQGNHLHFILETARAQPHRRTQGQGIRRALSRARLGGTAQGQERDPVRAGEFPASPA